MSLGIKGRFYANLSVLYSMATFYAKNLGAYSHVCDLSILKHNGKILRQLNLLGIISRVLPLPLCITGKHKEDILRRQPVWRKIFPL